MFRDRLGIMLPVHWMDYMLQVALSRKVQLLLVVRNLCLGRESDGG
jgi:hypothetical protein